MIEDGEIHSFSGKIQENLMKIADGVADPYNRDYKINDDKTELLEEEIDRLRRLLIYPKSLLYQGLSLVC